LHGQLEPAAHLELLVDVVEVNLDRPPELLLAVWP
jgi:hypothetical protein